MDNVDKRRIIATISKELGASQAVVKSIVEGFIGEIKNQYKNGNRVEIRGFGSFAPHLREGRSYKVPRTDKEIVTENTTILKFKASKQMLIHNSSTTHG